MGDMSKGRDLTTLLRSGKTIDLKERFRLVFQLSLPGILAQISEIIMQYIDAAMVGKLGAGASASIGLVSSSTWLIGGLLFATGAGFSVQVAHATGAGDTERVRTTYRQSLIASFLIAGALSLFCIWISSYLPVLLKADSAIHADASDYFRIYGIFLLIRMFYYLNQSMLQCTGNMKTPSIISSLMCILDVVFNFFLIFPSRNVTFLGKEITVWGAGLGVRGAALGTGLSFLCALLLIGWSTAVASPLLTLRVKASWKLRKETLLKAVRIGIPMALEQSALCLAQILSTRIIAPLGTVAIAANSFAITAESLCYMPGYGIESAATTLVGQAVGAKRKDIARSFAWLTTFTGIAIMSTTAFIMYFGCPYVFAFLTPDKEVQLLGTQVLRYELFAEPLFAASIVATGALRGAGDTIVPGIFNLISIWGVRLTLTFFLVRTHGLPGAWIAMAIELSFRGILFLIRLKREKWLERLDL